MTQQANKVITYFLHDLNRNFTQIVNISSYSIFKLFAFQKGFSQNFSENLFSHWKNFFLAPPCLSFLPRPQFRHIIRQFLPVYPLCSTKRNWSCPPGKISADAHASMSVDLKSFQHSLLFGMVICVL